MYLFPTDIKRCTFALDSFQLNISLNCSLDFLLHTLFTHSRFSFFFSSGFPHFSCLCITFIHYAIVWNVSFSELHEFRKNARLVFHRRDVSQSIIDRRSILHRGEVDFLGIFTFRIIFSLFTFNRTRKRGDDETWWGDAENESIFRLAISWIWRTKSLFNFWFEVFRFSLHDLA